MGKVFKSPVCDGLRVFASFFSRHSGGLGVVQDIFCPAGRWDGPFFSRLIVAAFSDFAIRHKVPQFFLQSANWQVPATNRNSVTVIDTR